MLATCAAPPRGQLDETLHTLNLDCAPVRQPTETQRPEVSPTELLIRKSKIMIVDDESYNVLVVRKFLQHSGYENFVTSTDSTKALELIRRQQPDVVLMDVMMPQVNGIDLMRAMKSDPQMATIPVVVLTASPESSIRMQALELGATDFLAKPVDSAELVLRVRNVLAAKAHFEMVAKYSVELEHEVARRTQELEESRRQVIQCLARAAEFRDNETGFHVLRVGRYAGIIARELGFSQPQVEAIDLAAQLHDVGKIGIPDAILHKPGKLDPEEFEFIQKHCGFGKKIIEPMPQSEWSVAKKHTEVGGKLLNVPTSPVLKIAARIALTHHEHWDGNGYPFGLVGEEIPIEGRITAIADVFDALSSRRSYKKAFARERCMTIMSEKRGTHFDPRIYDAFLRRKLEIFDIQLALADTE